MKNQVRNNNAHWQQGRKKINKKKPKKNNKSKHNQTNENIIHKNHFKNDIKLKINSEIVF